MQLKTAFCLQVFKTRGILTHQNSLAMKLTMFIFFVSLLQLHARSFSQVVTFSGKDVPLLKVFSAIEEQTGYVVFYNNRIIKSAKKVTIDAKAQPLEKFLKKCFTDQPLKYFIEDKTILVTRKDDAVVIEAVSSGKQDSLTNETPVTGKITNEAGEPLAGVSILLKGSKLAAVTNEKGEFRIDVPETSSKILLVSFVGMKTQEINVSRKTSIAVALVVSDVQQQEIVVVGYGTQRKSDITGSVSSVKTKDLTQNSTNRVDQALQGRVSGLMVQNNNAAPNSSVTIRIRGINSINGGNDPLIVIDGLQLGKLNTLDPNEVESIEVLKDASATSIYGARGANGVILVTTKKGRKGKPVISYNNYFTFSKVQKKLDLLNAEQYAVSVNANREELGLGVIFSDADIQGFKTHSTDWQDVIFRKGFSQNHQLSVSGASDATSYYLSADVNSQQGIIAGSSFQSYSMRSNVKTQVSQKLSVGLNFFATRSVDHPTIINTYGGVTNSGSPVFAASHFAPVKPVYDADGNYSQPGGGYGPPSVNNPLAVAVEPVIDNLLNTINIVSDIEYKITEDLKINILGGFQSTGSENNSYFNSKPSGKPGTEYAAIGNSRSTLLQNTNMLTYEKNFHKHRVKFTGVAEQQYLKNNGSTAGSIGFLTNSVTYYNLGLGNNPQIPSSYGNVSTLLSFMGRINYGFDERFSATITGRMDGSSVFGAANKWGYFPSVGLAWNVSNERFWNNGLKNSISSFKLRASYGVVGNQAISPYQSIASLNSNLPYIINGNTASTGVGLGKIENPDLKWEKTVQLNIGADMQLLQGRINLVADYYDKKISDLLFSVRLPDIGGGSGSILRNVGSMSNKGFELYISGTPLIKNFKWETGFTFSLNRNKILDLYNGLEELPLGDPGLPGFGNTVWLKVGQPVGLFKGYIMNGIWKSSEAGQAAVYGAAPGYPKYVDQNKDNKIDAQDIVVMGNAQPRFIYGWNNNFSYKNFDLNIFLQGVEGNKIYNVSRVRSEKSTGDGDATSVKILDRWTPDHENTDVPSFKGANIYERTQSNRWLEDGSYLRLKTISFGYTFSNAVLRSVKASSIRIYVSGNNLITSTNYSGYDPEARTNVDTRGGIDLATYPSQKSFIVGLNVKF